MRPGPGPLIVSTVFGLDMLERVLDARHERPSPAGLRAILLGADATPSRLLERRRRLGAPIALTWASLRRGGAEMLVLLKQNAALREAAAALSDLGLWVTPLVSPGDAKGLWVEAHSRAVSPQELREQPFVAEVLAPGEGRPLVSRWRGMPVRVGRLELGWGRPSVLAAGPCSAESQPQVEACARAVSSAGGSLLRGGASKPRTSPYAFRGHGPEALGWLRDSADRYGLGLVTEVLGEADIPPVAEVADMIQIGTRNMQSFGLLRAVGATGKPVLLKRGRAATIDEWLDAAEHLLVAGAGGVVFCERGVRGFDPRTRNLFDLGAVALMAHVERLPVLADPSHAAGRRDLLEPLSAAALAAGAHGLLLETHPDPSQALSDGPQALPLDELVPLAERLGFPRAAALVAKS